MRKTIISYLLLFVLIAPIAVQAEEKLPIIQAIYNKYAQNFLAIAAGRTERTAAAELDYLDVLMRYEDLAYESGNLDAVLAMQASLSYFKEHMQPQASDAQGPLAEAYDTFRREIARAQAYGARDYERYKIDYLNELKNLEIKMVKDRRLEVAIAAREETEAFVRAGLKHFSPPSSSKKKTNDKNSSKDRIKYDDPF